jgi:hypothetical protein
MSNGILNFKLNVGASFRVDFTWLFPDDPDNMKSEFNTPQDLTGWTGEMTGPSLAGFPLTLNLGGINGTVEGEILDTTSWSPGTYDYELNLTAADSSVDTILVGKICVDHIPQFSDP